MIQVQQKRNQVTTYFYYRCSTDGQDETRQVEAALKAGVHPVRIVRHDSSISQYGPNYFGNTLSGRTKNTPYSREDLNIFYSGSVGMFGESIYPIIW